MAFLQWRRFNFFYIQKDVDGGKIAESIKDCKITACEGGQGRVVVGDADGNIHLINRQLQVNTFRAYQLKVSHITILKQHPILVSIGEDDPGTNPVVKVWNLDKLDRSGSPLCVRLSRAIPGNKPVNATALAVHENLNYMAVGFQDGSVILYKGDVLRDRSGKSKIVHESRSPVTKLAFRTVPKAIYLFSVHRDEVWSLDLSSKEREKIKLDNHGTCPDCVIMSDGKHGHHLFVAKSDAIYCYTTDGRGPCYAFEGDKLLIHWFRGHLILLTRESGTTKANVVSGENMADKTVVTIYDMDNKLIAYSAPAKPVSWVVSEWGFLYLFHSDGKITQLAEKDTRSKLDMLFRKNLFDIAIKLAKGQNVDSEELMDIFRQYGDHLYSKGDYNGAIDQYIHTIGKLEEAYVIRKFMASARIHNLSAYLEALHKKGLATEDHTTLLLNCYTKLRDTQKLDHFIMNENSAEFDVEIALKVCRQAGYYKHALWLAERHRLHATYLKIQLEDNKDYKEALKYLNTLSPKQIELNVKKYGAQLMEHAPDDTTALLKKLCSSLDESDECVDAEDLMHVFVSAPDKLREFLEHLLKIKPNLSDSVFNSLLEVYLNDLSCSGESEQIEYEKKILDLLQNPDSHYDMNQALVLCRQRGFHKGMLFLYEKAGLYQQILEFYMEEGDYDSVYSACRKFSGHDPGLWLSTLRYFAKCPTAPENFLKQILSNVESDKLLPPLLVLEILFQSSTATLDTVRDYVMRILEQENSQMEEDEKLIKQYKQDTDDMKAQIEALQTSATVFQASKCNACNHPLELPSVHFLCRHSFHQHCFESYADTESECPVCLPENKKILDIIKAQEQAPDIYETFHTQLERAEDGFSVIADYYGRGIFSSYTPSSLESEIKLHSSSVSPHRPLEEELIPYPAPSEGRIRSWEIKSDVSSAEAVGMEGRLRLQEGKLPTNITPEYPKSEARIRVQESLQANIIKSSPYQPENKPKQEPLIETQCEPTQQPQQHYDESKNPFADEDDDKNPFNDDSDDKNPFKDDYDESLNPFS